MERKSMTAGSEVAILSRIIDPDKPELPEEMARLVLQWKFNPADRRRVHDLLEKAKAGTLTADEKTEADSYERVGHFISMLKAKACASLRPSPRPS
jgi:hypothetical protein